jgi:hypothetical protein
MKRHSAKRWLKDQSVGRRRTACTTLRNITAEQLVSRRVDLQLNRNTAIPGHYSHGSLQTHTISFTNTPTQVLFTLSRGIGFRSQPTSKQRNIWWRWNTCTEVLVDFILLKYKLLDLWRLNKRFNVQIILFNIHPLNLPDIDVSDYRMCKCLWEKSLIMEIKVCL